MLVDWIKNILASFNRNWSIAANVKLTANLLHCFWHHFGDNYDPMLLLNAKIQCTCWFKCCFQMKEKWIHLIMSYILIVDLYWNANTNCSEKFLFPFPMHTYTLHCLIEDTCLLFSRTAFLLEAFYYTLYKHLKDQRVYYCTLDFDYLVAAFY